MHISLAVNKHERKMQEAHQSREKQINIIMLIETLEVRSKPKARKPPLVLILHSRIILIMKNINF